MDVLVIWSGYIVPTPYNLTCVFYVSFGTGLMSLRDRKRLSNTTLITTHLVRFNRRRLTVLYSHSASILSDQREYLLIIS
jgi:hypothetical protein